MERVLERLLKDSLSSFLLLSILHTNDGRASLFLRFPDLHLNHFYTETYQNFYKHKPARSTSNGRQCTEVFSVFARL